MTSPNGGRHPRRRREGSKYRKLAITVPEALARAVEEYVKAHEASSISAFISDAVEEKLERDRLKGILDKAFMEEPMTP